MPFVCSTATNDAFYCEYDKGGADLPVLKRRVLIKGGANRGGKNLTTPHGVVTSVSDDELEFLKANPAFQRHVKKGFLTVVEQKKAPDADKVSKDMQEGDGSMPLQEKDYKAGGRMAGRAAPGTQLEPPASIGKVGDKGGKKGNKFE